MIAASLDRPDVFGEVVERHAHELHRFLSRRLGNRADDLLGELFVTAFELRASYRAQLADARPWLYGIAANLVRRHHRAEATRARAGPAVSGRPGRVGRRRGLGRRGGGPAATVDVDGHRAAVIDRTMRDGTPAVAPAVTVVWQGDDDEWTAVTRSGSFADADADRVAAIAGSLRARPQPVHLALTVAPEGWSVVAHKEDRILTLSSSGRPDGGADALTVALLDRRGGDP